MEKRSKKRKMVLRLWQRLAIAFCAIIFLIMSGVIALHVRTMRAMREAIYGRMERFRKLDETLFMRRKKSREQKEAAASRLPWKRKHKM